MKGHVYLGARQFYGNRVPGGVNAVAAQLAEAGLVHFWNQPFVARMGYDLLPMVTITEAAARAAGVQHLEFVRESARWQARRDIEGLLKLVLKLASPELVARALPRASMHYFEFGAARGELVGRRCLHAVQTGVPMPLTPWMSACVEGFVPIAMEAAGARSVVVEHRLGPVESAASPIPVVQIDYRIEWA